MKKFWLNSTIKTVSLAVAILATLVSFSGLQSVAQESSDLRVMSYNIRNGRGLDDKTDYARTANVILKETPDVVAIQELDQKTKRSKGVDVLEELAKLTDMNPSYGPAIDFQGGKYGIGVLSKEKPIKAEHYSLPGREEKRCLLVVEFEKYVFFCSHWSLTEEDRDTTVDFITNKMKEQQKPVVLCGDFNAEPNEDSIKKLQRDWTIVSLDKFTFPADNPNIRIDYICVADPQNSKSSEEWLKAVKNARVVEEPVASDHRPIALEIDANAL